MNTAGWKEIKITKEGSNQMRRMMMFEGGAVPLGKKKRGGGRKGGGRRGGGRRGGTCDIPEKIGRATGGIYRTV